jgi:hypothetical protein
VQEIWKRTKRLQTLEGRAETNTNQEISTELGNEKHGALMFCYIKMDHKGDFIHNPQSDNKGFQNIFKASCTQTSHPDFQRHETTCSHYK